MNKREFIKTSAKAGIGLTVLTGFSEQSVKEMKRNGHKHWVWENPNQKETDDELAGKYRDFYAAGIRGMFFESDSERHFRIAKKAGLESHRWMWTMNRTETELLNAHPEMYAVSRDGKSCATNPPYVGHYRWLCPTRPETMVYLEQKSKEILEKEYVDGLHLDYVRYCDVILPVNLWDKYGIDQRSELPEYDFCYCDACREKYKAEYGIDPLKMEYPDQSASWRKFRYQQINGIVNRLAELAKSFNKPITAAVFPTPEIARRIVRQDWTNWNLDAVCPMIYHGFYREPVKWIGDAVQEGLHFLCDRFPVYAGLFIPDFKTDEELEEGISIALQSGALGVSFFGHVDERVLAILKKVQSAF